MPIKYCRYGFSLICSTVSESLLPNLSLIINAPNAILNDWAGAPVEPGLFHSGRVAVMITKYCSHSHDLSCLNLPLSKPLQTYRIPVEQQGNVIIKRCDTALFTLGVAAGNRGFLAIGDWLKAHQEQLVTLFQPPQGRLPSYSTIRRTLLRLEYQTYSGCLSRFFGIQPMPVETIALDGKVLRGSYECPTDDPTVDSHPAIMLVSAYIVERGLILEP